MIKSVEDAVSDESVDKDLLSKVVSENVMACVVSVDESEDSVRDDSSVSDADVVDPKSDESVEETVVVFRESEANVDSVTESVDDDFDCSVMTCVVLCESELMY